MASFVAASAPAGAQAIPVAVRWSVPLGAPASGAPVVAGDRTVVSLQPGELSARLLRDGREIWKASLAPVQPLEVDAGRLFVATADAVHAIELADGSPVWETPTGTPTAPLLARDGWVFVAADGQVIALRGSDGARIWAQPLGAMAERPALDGNRLFVPLADGRLAALDVQTGDVVWQVTTDGEPAEPLAVAGRVYFGAAGQFICLHAETGDLDWQRRVGPRVLGRPAVDDDRVYFTAMDNVVRAIGRTGGSIRWHAALPYRPISGPVRVGVHVTAPGLVKDLRAFSPSSGKTSGTIALSETLGAAPAFVPAVPPQPAGLLAITSNDRNEWHLLLVGVLPPPPPPLPVAPLSELPGLVMPVGG